MNPTQTEKQQNPYDINSVGCYVDSARGIYAVDAICSFVEDHGKKWERDELFDIDDSDPNPKQISPEAEDIADDYMNSNYPVDGAYWGRNENGDWGLWSCDDDA